MTPATAAPRGKIAEEMGERIDAEMKRQK